jgi:hypothetical protein
MCESSWEASKNESLADDNNTLMLMEEDNLRALRKFLDDFGNTVGVIKKNAPPAVNFT